MTPQWCPSCQRHVCRPLGTGLAGLFHKPWRGGLIAMDAATAEWRLATTKRWSWTDCPPSAGAMDSATRALGRPGRLRRNPQVAIGGGHGGGGTGLVRPSPAPAKRGRRREVHGPRLQHRSLDEAHRPHDAGGLLRWQMSLLATFATAVCRGGVAGLRSAERFGRSARSGHPRGFRGRWLPTPGRL